MLLAVLGHAFGSRYDLPVPLSLFVGGGAVVVFISFLIVLPTKVRTGTEPGELEAITHATRWSRLRLLTLIPLALTIFAGLAGGQAVAENIVPTLVWVVVWVAMPISCGLLGD